MSDTKAPAAPTEVKLTIDGVSVAVAPGSTIIQAAHKAGKVIPHFCYHPGLPVVGQCRMCFVEVEKMPKLATACSQPVSEGMNVFTASEKVKAGQKGTLEFTLLNHPLDCPICDRGGECKLQDFTYEYGPSLSRMDDEKVLRDKHKPISEQIVLDQERCILCTRCTRFSADVDGRAELVVNARGNENHIDVFEGRPLKSNFSGNVVDLCPVGALTAKDFRFAARPWELKKHDALCTGCAGGCNIEIHTKHRHPGIVRPDKKPPNPQIQRLVPRENSQVNQWWMCDSGRWGYHFHNEDSKRLVAPQVRRTKKAPLVDVSLREIQAFLEAQQKLGSWEFWIEGSVPHEGIQWAKELATSWTARGREVRALNESPFAREFLSWWSSRMGSAPWMTEAADWSGIKAVVSPYDIRELESVAPILALRLGQAVRRHQLMWVKGTLAEKSREVLEQYGVESVAFLLNPPASSQALAELKQLHDQTKLLILWSEANSRGLLNEGVVPVEAQQLNLSNSGPQGPVFFFGQRTQQGLSRPLMEYLAKAPFLIVADSFSSELSECADIVLPLTPLYESPSTLTNLENRQQFSKGIALDHPNVTAVHRGGAFVSASLRLL